jgi:hypothetical protein
MSGSAGGNRIPREAVEATKNSYIRKVLSKFPGFKDAKISGSYNATGKSDFGDIDLIVTLEGDDKKKLKQDLAAFFAEFPDNLVIPFKSDKYKGKKSLASGELVTILYPIEGMPGQFIQIDNMVSTSEAESEFKKSFLDYPAEIQGLILGLTKVMLLEKDPTAVFRAMGIKDIPEAQEGQEYEFNLSSAGLTLRLVDLSPDFKETGRQDVWKTSDWGVAKKLYDGFRIDGTFEELLKDIAAKCKNPRSKNRIKGIFKSMVSIKSGEVGTPKGAGKQQALDRVGDLLEFFTGLGRSIGSRIVFEAEEGFKPGVCIYPGAFKPPHKGHFEAAKDLASRPYVTQVKVIISPKERQGITANQSLEIWETYLEAQPNIKISVEIAKSPSPITDAANYIEDHPKEDPIYVAGSKSEVDDLGYFKSLQKKFGDRVIPIPVEEKFGRISASYVRDLLRAGDYEGFKEAIPTAAADRGKTEDIFNMLTQTVGPRPLKEGIESSSVGSDIVAALTKFVNWCQQALEIQQLPKIDYIDSPTFTRDNKSFGGYTPFDNSILLSIYNRNPADIMRTLAHELVHCKQNETGRLTSGDGETGSDIENEANAVAGIIMRMYGRSNPEIFESTVTEGAPGTFKAKITKTYGGDATIEKAKKFKARQNATTLDKKQANWFINMHSKNEAITPDEVQKVDDFADQVLAPVDIDLTSKHVFDRLTGRESDVTYDQLIRFFEKLGQRKKEFIDFFNRYEEIVATDRKSKLNIPFLNLTNKAIAKTIMRKDNFLTHTPKLTFENDKTKRPTK